MKSKIILIFMICYYFTSPSLLADVDPFYLNIFKDGIILFNEGKYEDAIENFKIAEFGLLDENKILTEIYFYHVLSCYKLKRWNESRKMLRKLIELKNDLNIKDIESMNIPHLIKSDVKTMLSVLLKKEGNVKHSTLKKTEIRQAHDFETTYQKALENLRSNQLKNVINNIKILKKINKKDIRIDYLKGILAFRQKKYRDSISILGKIYKSVNKTFKNNVYYYLALSFYFEKNYGQTLAFYYKITDKDIQNKLENISRKVLIERNAAISRLTSNFSKKNLKKLINRFEGDQYICAAILKNTLNKYVTGSQIIHNIIHSCLNYPKSYNREFILSASLYMENIKNIKSAIHIIEKSRFYKKTNPENIEIYYKLGQLYYTIQKYNKALKNLLIVNKFKKKYKKTDFYLDKIKINK